MSDQNQMLSEQYKLNYQISKDRYSIEFQIEVPFIPLQLVAFDPVYNPTINGIKINAGKELSTLQAQNLSLDLAAISLFDLTDFFVLPGVLKYPSLSSDYPNHVIRFLKTDNPFDGNGDSNGSINPIDPVLNQVDDGFNTEYETNNVHATLFLPKVPGVMGGPTYLNDYPADRNPWGFITVNGVIENPGNWEIDCVIDTSNDKNFKFYFPADLPLGGGEAGAPAPQYILYYLTEL